ncbi:MAG TPA: AAA family ATPase [Terriglobia bacterium]|nr:AAA family ATPase [Terriglobia bacterium]
MATTAPTNSISIFGLLDALRRRKLFVIIPTLLITAGFVLYAYTQPSRYRSTALLGAEQVAPPDYLKRISPPPINMGDQLWKVREIVFSPPVLEAAAKELKQYRDVPGKLPARALDELKTDIIIKLDGEHTFQLTYDGLDRYEAMNVTNKLAQLLVQETSENHEQKDEQAESVINDQLDALKKRLEKQGKELQDYKGQVAHALPDHIDYNLRQAQELNFRYENLATKISEEEAKRTAIQKQIEALDAKGISDQPIVYEKTPAETKLDELRITESELETRYTPDHPEVIKAKRRISELEKEIAAQPKKKRSEPTQSYLKYVELKSELDGIRQRIEAYKQDQKNLSTEMVKTSSIIEATPRHERVIEDMRREYDVGASQFHELLNKQLDAKLAQGLASAGTGVTFSIVETAGLPTAPYSPQRARLLLMGLAAGLGLGFALTFILEQNDTTFGTVDDFQAFTTLPVLGVIPNFGRRIKNTRKALAKGSIVTIAEPESVAAEQYRLLALKVRQQCESANLKVVTVTSSAGAEGKSLTAINMAAALAATVQGKVLIVDADMRKPRVSEYLGLSVLSGRGFHDLVRNPEDALEKYVHKAKGDVYVIPGGVPSSNPVATLSSPKTRAVFERLRQHFAMIIVDAPPTLPIADSHILSGLSDKVVFVVRARLTPRELFQHAVESFDASNVLGAVLNDVDYHRSRYAYAYEYYKKAA